MRFSVCNLGCKVNSYEAQSVSALLEKKGWQKVPFEQPADVSVIFTCAVTNTAAAKSRKMMHRVRRLNPEAVTVMVGCYTEVNDGLIEDADIIAGTAYKKMVPALIDEYMETSRKIRMTGSLDNIKYDNLTADTFDGRTRAYLKIQDGCNQFCSYCVIPYARGRERSMDFHDAVEQAKIIARSYSEIVLTGIHTGRYGRGSGYHLADLMKQILKEADGLARLRISSIEVTEVSDELISLMKEDTRVARHLHIPLQSGCNRILKKMKRPYTTEEYLSRIEEIRRELPGVSISTDLITGFPSESEEDFMETYRFLQECAFSFLHVFPYSERTGTEAASMPEVVPPAVRKERTGRCMELSRRLLDEYMNQMTGRHAVIIPEETEEGYTKGYSSEYISVLVPGTYPHGVPLEVVLKEVKDHRMYGEVAL